jgi:hypothetical protein
MRANCSVVMRDSGGLFRDKRVTTRAGRAGRAGRAAVMLFAIEQMAAIRLSQLERQIICNLANSIAAIRSVLGHAMDEIAVHVGSLCLSCNLPFGTRYRG